MRILLADNNEARSSALFEKLRGPAGHEVMRLRPGQSLIEAVAEHRADIVIVDMARPDRDALDGVRELTARDPRPIAMFVDESDSSFMAEAIAAGVCSYTVVGGALPDIRPVVESAIMIYKRFARVTGDLETAHRRLEEREAVARAKAALMRGRGLSEPQAYQWLRRTAMNGGRKIADVAREILTDSMPPDSKR